MTFTWRGRRGPLSRPQRWQRVLTASVALGSAAGSIASNILANQITNQNFGPLTWATAGLATVTAAAFAGLQVQNRRAREAERAAVPPPIVRFQPLADLPFTSGFIGRRATLDWIVDAIRAEHALALVGRRAVGTSACVIEAANMVRARYPDGQLYLDLRQADRSLRPREVLDALCRKLGIDQSTLGKARDLDAVTSLLRSHLGERRVLLVLDNVSEPEQVRPLLPPAPHCRLLMAGSGALDGLDGVRVRRLAEPSTEEAMEIFATAVRDAGPVRRDLRADASVREMVELAGRQPNAVRELGYWMGVNGWSAPELLATLRRAMALPGRPDATLRLLADRDRAYAALGRGARRLYRLLALMRQPLSRGAIAALCGINRGRADRMLAELVAGAFATATADGRYRLRPLLAEYARVHLCCTEPRRRQAAAQGRVVRHLARQAERYAAALSGPVPAAQPVDDPGTYWFTRHEALLRTVVCGPWGSPGALPATPPARVRRWWLRLAVALCTWYATHARLDDWAAVCRAVLDSPVARERPALAGWAHNELGAVYRWQGNLHQATVELATAVTLRHRRGAAQSRTNLGLALLDQNDVDGALDQLQRAHRQRSPTDRAGQALTELGLGAAFLARQEPLKARHHLILAANRFDAVGDRRGYAAALTNLVLAQWWLGERLDAAHAWNAALESYEIIGDQYGHAVALLNAGAVIISDDPARAGRARELLLESLRLRESTSQPVGRTLLYLGDAAHALDEPDEAQRYWKEAAEACRVAGDDDGTTAARQRMSA
jgi:tetratricopeptide (TPR) repeat protein